MVHLTTRSAWAQAQQVGHSSHPSLLTDGYIHCSTPTEEQVIAVANAYFVGQSDLVLLHIDPERLTSELRDEEYENSGLFFPHVYGPINLEAVVGVSDFLPAPDGLFSLSSIVSLSSLTASSPTL
ncbi:DUF952 domain-containing protein [Deinococcus aquatilis]|jgi:uncharacterized protein (DUF952 family)|uniref:DUF952 domain-containing protein n=1 Tax=Deinococcus aquatilis TaxID=519440 RepID=UPI000687A717|nr:DUF952 domain-containing protein [Deinococcus aquatilis]